MDTRQPSRISQQKRGNRVRAIFISASLVAGILFCMMASSGAHARWLPIATLGTEPQSGASQTAAPSQLTVTISNQGMTPASATVRTGIVHLFLENPEGLENLRLRVSREGGELMREITIPNKSTEWATELELSAGQYVITGVNNPSLTCHIIVQAPPNNNEGQPGSGAVSNP